MTDQNHKVKAPVGAFFIDVGLPLQRIKFICITISPI